MFFQPMSLLEFVPLIMIQFVVLIYIQCIENIRCRLGEIEFELIPAHPIIAIHVYIPEVCVK